MVHSACLLLVCALFLTASVPAISRAAYEGDEENLPEIIARVSFDDELPLFESGFCRVKSFCLDEVSGTFYVTDSSR